MTFHRLFDDFQADQDSTDQGLPPYFLALLQEAAGQRQEALANFHLVLSSTLVEAARVGNPPTPQ